MSRLAHCIAAMLVISGYLLAETPAGFTALTLDDKFTGWVGGSTADPKTITDEQQQAWNADLAAHWRAEGDEIISDGHGPHLVTAREYGDFELWVDWWLAPNGDSGIYLREMPQVQIWDPTNKAAHAHGSDKGSGALWNNEGPGKWPLVLADKPCGEWNRMYIRMVGPVVKVVLNDQLVVDDARLENYFDRNADPFSEGRIHLQTHGSETRFRRILIREIPSDEAAELLDDIKERK